MNCGYWITSFWTQKFRCNTEPQVQKLRSKIMKRKTKSITGTFPRKTLILKQVLRSTGRPFLRKWPLNVTPSDDKVSSRNPILHPWDLIRQAKNCTFPKPATIPQWNQPSDNWGRPLLLAHQQLTSTNNTATFKINVKSCQVHSQQQCQHFMANLRGSNCLKIFSKKSWRYTTGWQKTTR